MRYVKINKLSLTSGRIRYNSSESNYGPLSTFGMLYDGWPYHQDVIDWLLSSHKYYGYNALYFEKAENNLVEVGLEWEQGEYNPISTFFIDRDNFIEVIKTFEQLREQRYPEIIIEQDEKTRKVTCRASPMYNDRN